MANQYDAIIVLGGGRTNKGDLTTLSKQRLDAGCELYLAGKAKFIVALGGDTVPITQTQYSFQMPELK
jgi:vancomycin permeability regulator SanA